jgi:hypothetical protein
VAQQVWFVTSLVTDHCDPVSIDLSEPDRYEPDLQNRQLPPSSLLLPEQSSTGDTKVRAWQRSEETFLHARVPVPQTMAPSLHTRQISFLRFDSLVTFGLFEASLPPRSLESMKQKGKASKTSWKET